MISVVVIIDLNNMKCKKVFTDATYLLMMSFFLYDSYSKLTHLSNEADLLRSKY